MTSFTLLVYHWSVIVSAVKEITALNHKCSTELQGGHGLPAKQSVCPPMLQEDIKNIVQIESSSHWICMFPFASDVTAAYIIAMSHRLYIIRTEAV